MRERWLKRIICPMLAIWGIVVFASGLLLNASLNRYRAENQVALAELAGRIDQAYPDLDGLELAQILQNKASDPALRQRGLEILRAAGILETDWVSQDAAALTRQTFAIILALLSIGALISIGYFCWRDWQRTRQVKNLVQYLQDLSRQIYDLRLTENREDELSLLTNELYKITVTLKESAVQNRESREHLETALADISHQLRTPLTSLQVTIDNIYDDPKMPAKTRQEFLRLASQQVAHISRLVTTLLYLAKFDSGTIQLKRSTLPIGQILQDVTSNLAVLADLYEIEIVCEGDLEARLELDRHWQTEALTNIVKNAIEHSPAGSQVVINVHNSALFCKIIIRDAGEGITPADRKHLFERFYKSAHSRPESIGIGLSFAKAIIEADHGQIGVKSEPGVGTEFIVRYFK